MSDHVPQRDPSLLTEEIAGGYGADTPGVEHARAEIARVRA